MINMFSAQIIQDLLTKKLFITIKWISDKKKLSH